MGEIFMPADSRHVKKERERARELKKSQWWKDKIRAGVCYYCEKNFPPGELSMDHIVPLIRGGKTGKNNTVVACKTCNSQKSYKTLVQLKLQKP